MTGEQAQKLRDFRAELHISHSQIFIYLNCSLKYYFAYVEGRIPERRPAALLLGSSLHGAIARYYWGLKKIGDPEPLSLLQNLAEDHLIWDIGENEIPVAFKEGSDKESLLADSHHLVESIFKVRPVLRGYHLVDFYHPFGQSVLSPEDENRFVVAYFRNVYLPILS